MTQEILSLDLSSSSLYLSWGKWSDAKIITHKSTHNFTYTPQTSNSYYRIQHSEVLIEQLEVLRNAVQGNYDALSCIVVNEGPGSFTGLRIALSLARGMQSASRCAIVGVNGMELWAHIHAPRPLLVVLDARSKKFYTQLFLPHNTTQNDHTIQDLALDQIHDMITSSINSSTRISSGNISDSTSGNSSGVFSGTSSGAPHEHTLAVSGFHANEFMRAIKSHHTQSLPRMESQIKEGTEIDIGYHLLLIGLKKYLAKDFLEQEATPLYIRGSI